ncbi:hypothetical protein [Amphibiibacter pelophylacis]|uniref:Uncharacterized protein n=1 Tax=Amphibiibacter pelophylacis TaxID=1799477 RepID=A0ACC6NZZ5_9BURK
MTATDRPDPVHCAVRSVYAYAFDVAETGVDAMADHLRGSGFNGLTLALSYHAGKFLRPQSRSSAVVFPQDGVVYFDPDRARYGELTPQPHSEAAVRSVARAWQDSVATQGLALHAWTVLLHNSRLGALHPQYTARNALGDGYVYSLCPSHAAVREYAVALCADIARLEPASLVLETPGWLPYAHGYHHEFAQVRSNPWLEQQLGLCFCPACVRLGQARGLDAPALRARTAQRIQRYLHAPVDAPADMAQAWLQADLVADPELAAWHRLRQETVTALVADIRAALPARVALGVIPSVQRPSSLAYLEGSDWAALARTADWVEVPFYEPDAARVAADAWDVCCRVGEDAVRQRRVRAILRPGPPDLGDGREVAQALEALAQAGIADVSFYNHGLLRAAHWQRLAATLRGHAPATVLGVSP